MRTVRISEEVWDEIAKKGVFGESVDDVLRRVFNIEGKGRGKGQRRQRYATNKMSCGVVNQTLFVEFADGARMEWSLPEKHDKNEIRDVRDQAIDFAEREGASVGQRAAVRRALTNNGYHLIK